MSVFYKGTEPKREDQKWNAITKPENKTSGQDASDIYFDPTQEEIDARKEAKEKPFDDLEEQIYHDYEQLKEMARKEVIDELKEIIKQNRENWSLGLTYMADDRFENQFEVAKKHLDIIFADLIFYIEKI